MKNYKIINYVIFLTTELTDLIISFQNLISGAIARAIYVTGSPLSMLEHPLWKEALHHLNPDYTPPNRKRMSTTLLDSEFNDTKNRIESAINNAKVLHLAADGWSNVRNEGILNIFVFTPRPFFYSFVDTKANRHTSEYLMSEIAKVIDKLGPEKFMSIITDNASNMKRCGETLGRKISKCNVEWVFSSYITFARFRHFKNGNHIRVCFKNYKSHKNH